MADIFNEIDEELRRDNLLKLWRRYGIYLVGLAVLVVLIVAGVVMWRDHQLWQRQEAGRSYAAALAIAQQGKDTAAAEAMAELAQQTGGGRAVVARLAEAVLKTKAKDRDGAIAVYEALAQDRSVDKVYRDYALLLAERYRLEKDDPKTVIAGLAPLTAADNPWRSTALELTAFAELKAGDKDAARAQFEALMKDPASPQSLQQRASQMVTALSQ